MENGRRTLHRFEIRGVDLLAYDEEGSLSADRVAGELLADVYGLESVPFRAGDVVIDVGAHVGLVSIYLAKRWPLLRIHAFEPHPVNHRSCAENLRLNGVGNVRLERRAVTADGRAIELRCLPSNTGGATAAFDLPGAGAAVAAPSATLAAVCDAALPPGGRCRLLKLDCEGMEYEILSRPRALERIDYLAAELHYGDDDGPARALAAHCARFIPAERLRFVFCPKRD
ncbi:MAG TPA: FkbM family methyltransferase [Thermoanaerobaculia bacterium]|nr:FkbM family methyltransferase [Thermoanaerobaculia bacterium]